MTIFGGRTPQTPAAGFSVVDDRLTIRGNIDTDGTVRVDGRVEGSSHFAGTLIVGVGGLVVGHVEAKEVVVAGQIHGNVQARGRIEIESGAAVHGEVRAHAMVLREGGVVDGRVSIGGEGLPVNPPGRRLELTPSQSAPATGRLRG
jgi:cytoskeletal protein CcmA (bactofilin family)